ncbi:MAG: RDD family protein [Mycoplasmatales bacterium]
MILTLKRMIAKLIDLVLFSIVAFFVTMLITVFLSLIFSSLINENSFMMQWINNAPTSDMEAMISYFNENKIYTLYLSSIGSIFLLINGFIYFGVIGERCHGSLGKYAMHIEIINNNYDIKLSKVKLFLREPFMHYILFVFLTSFVALFYEPFAFISEFIVYIYLISLLLNNDFWSKLMKFKII